VSDVAWAADSRRLAYVMRVRESGAYESDLRRRPAKRIATLKYHLNGVGYTADRRGHVFVVDREGGKPAQVTDGPYEDSAPSWSPDGCWLAFISSRHEDWDHDRGADVFVVGTAGDELRAVTGTFGTCDQPVWSPDGASIAFLATPGLTELPYNTRLYVTRPAGGEPWCLTANFDRDLRVVFPPKPKPAWSADGRHLTFLAQDRGRDLLYRVPIDGGPVEELVGGDRRISYFTSSGHRLAYASSTPTQPSDIFVAGEDGRGERRLTRYGDEFAREVRLSPPERFVAQSEGGVPVEAWIMKPAGFVEGKRYPCVLHIHGGPDTQYGWSFFDEFQVYAGAGYGVLFTNPRGSSGYGEAWARAIRGGWGTCDYADLMAVTEEAGRRCGWIDPERLGVMGGSYGGYATSWIVGQTDRFKAAVSERAANDLRSMVGTSQNGGAWIRQWYPGTYFDYPELYARSSPLHYAPKVNRPLLILHYEEDMLCPLEQAQQFYAALKLLGKREVELIVFPGENHDMSRSGSPSHRVERFGYVLEWWARRL
jgi:dipeptidyl aminopeptidase/acylaminoacyl peptidase